MNKNIARPLIIQFAPPETKPELKQSSKSVFVPVNTPWNEFRDRVLPMVTDPAYDSVLVHVTNNVDRDMKGVVGNMSVKINALAGTGTKLGKPVLSYESADKPFYLANPTQNDMKAAGIYAPADDTIMEKYNSFESDDAWQEHQDKVWGRMKDMMPLSKKADRFNRDHGAQLKDPKRGLEDKDLNKFWSFKPRQGLSPTIMGDDMVGMPSVEGREYEGFTMSVKQPDGTVNVKPLQVRSLMTVGAAGIAIPMANANGHVNKHQIAADLTPYGTALHFRAADGKTVSKGELFDKKTREYAFQFADGSDTHLKVTAVAMDDTITLQDTHGIFNVKPKREIVDVLKDRGYNVPDIITSVKAEQNGKYMWQSPGTMTGSDTVLKTVSPSNPGFIKAREPKNGSNQYIALIAEGALKGHIVAKYVDVKDKDGVCFGDQIAGDRGIIVTQVPGVAEAYVKNAVSIYDKYDIAGTFIAMDADGRENRNVARGIHSAYAYISKTGPTKVLSWDPAQKGMDDALLAVAQGKITVKEMKLVSGTPEVLFPMANTKKMTPYKLDGTQTNTPTWVQEYGEQKQARQEKVAAAQAETAARVQGEKDTVKEKATAWDHFADNEKSDQSSAQWVETPNDISNIQNMTVTKAAEMADAMAGVIPPQKVDRSVTHTPDPDELAAMAQNKAEAGQKTGLENWGQLIKEVGRWEQDNPPMPPLSVPDGYKASYNYSQPVAFKEGAKLDSKYELQPVAGSNEHGDVKWAIVNITMDHEMSAAEKETQRSKLDQGGITCVNGMRLVSQTFTLDNERKIELSADDLKINDPDGVTL